MIENTDFFIPFLVEKIAKLYALILACKFSGLKLRKLIVDKDKVPRMTSIVNGLGQ